MSALSFIVTAICFLTAIRKKVIPLYLLGVFFVFYSLGSLFEGLADLYLNIFIRNLAGVSTIFFCLVFILFFNYVSKESLVSIHLAPWSAISAIFLFLELQPSNHSIIMQAGHLSLSRNDLLSNVFSLLWALVVLYVLYWGILTVVKAPKDLKKSAWLLIGSFPIGALVIYIISFFMYEPIAWGLILLTTSILIIVARSSQLLYILPFKAHLLMVIETESGLPLYQYHWSKQAGVEDGLLSGLISAITSMGEDILKRGRIRQIDWDLGMLIFAIGDSITVTLLSTKGSKALRASLLLFKDEFEAEFRVLLKFGNRDTAEYDAADELIAKYFANIPKYL